MSADRSLDVVVFGATGFVGKLTAEYLERHAPEGVRIGLGASLTEVQGGLDTFQITRLNSAITPPAVVPEPSTWALLGTGLLSIGGMAARRRRA